MVLAFISVFAVSWVVMSLVWLYLNRKEAKHNEKLNMIKAIAMETNMSRENVERLYDLIMD